MDENLPDHFGFAPPPLSSLVIGQAKQTTGDRAAHLNYAAETYYAQLRTLTGLDRLEIQDELKHEM